MPQHDDGIVEAAFVDPHVDTRRRTRAAEPGRARPVVVGEGRRRGTVPRGTLARRVRLLRALSWESQHSGRLRGSACSIPQRTAAGRPPPGRCCRALVSHPAGPARPPARSCGRVPWATAYACTGQAPAPSPCSRIGRPSGRTSSSSSAAVARAASASSSVVSSSTRRQRGASGDATNRAAALRVPEPRLDAYSRVPAGPRRPPRTRPRASSRTRSRAGRSTPRPAPPAQRDQCDAHAPGRDADRHARHGRPQGRDHRVDISGRQAVLPVGILRMDVERVGADRHRRCRCEGDLARRQRHLRLHADRSSTPSTCLRR